MLSASAEKITLKLLMIKFIFLYTYCITSLFGVERKRIRIEFKGIRPKYFEQ